MSNPRRGLYRTGPAVPARASPHDVTDVVRDIEPETLVQLLNRASAPLTIASIAIKPPNSPKWVASGAVELYLNDFGVDTHSHANPNHQRHRQKGVVGNAEAQQSWFGAHRIRTQSTDQ